MTLPATFKIALDFHSDWHIGTGQGRLGTVDAQVRRDNDGLPFVPAKTVVGVWRDACETVAHTLDRTADRPQAWHAWVTWLFGSQAAQPADGAERAPVPAALRLTPARAPAWLRHGVRGRPALAQAAVVLRPGVEIDDDTGTAVDRGLRVEERAIRGLRLCAQATVVLSGPTGGVTSDDPTAGGPATDDPGAGVAATHGPATGGGELPAPAELLLRAGARLVEAVGGKRNRGSGRVTVLLPGARVDQGSGHIHPTVVDERLVELLAAGPPATPPPPPAPAKAVEFYPYDRLHRTARRTVRVVLRVLTPVVAAHEVLGNAILSRDAIPGTALLGTMMRRAEPAPGAHTGRPGRIGLGDISVGDAVPAVLSDRTGTGTRDEVSVVPARPVPAVWQRSDKGLGTAVYNTLRAEPERGERTKPMSGWIASDRRGWRQVTAAMAVSTHAVVDDEARRPTVASGGVYTYLGIAPGTLLCSDVVLPAGFRIRLDRGERLRFGRSRKDDFGLVEVVEVVDSLPTAPDRDLETATLRVWCVSDVLLRDERLTPDPSPPALARAVSAALAPASCTVRATETVSGVARRDGFGVAWGRPRPSQVALRAGSVITLAVTGRVDPARLAELERDGIGERTVEGYGRVRFNPPELEPERPAVTFAGAGKQDQPAYLPPKPADLTVAGGTDQGEGVPETAHPLELNAWRRAIRRASAELHPDTLVPGISRLARNRAQLGSLRGQLERLTLPGGREMVRNWLAQSKAVRARREMWTQEVLAALTALLIEDPNRVWERLTLDGEQPLLVLGPGREETVRQRLHTEALVVSVGDALQRLTRTTVGSGSGPNSATVKENR